MVIHSATWALLDCPKNSTLMCIIYWWIRLDWTSVQNYKRCLSPSICLDFGNDVKVPTDIKMLGNKTFHKTNLWCNSLSKLPAPLPETLRQLWPVFSASFFQWVLLDWAHYETIISSSTCMISGLVTSAFSVPMIQWQPLEQISSLKSKWILNYPIFDTGSFDQCLPNLPSSWGVPQSPSVSWWVWMWKYVTTLLPLSKGSSCYVPLNLIWGFSRSEPWHHSGFLTRHVGCIIPCGWGVMKPHWVKTPTHPSWNSTTLMKCFITPLVSLCDFSCVKHFIVKPF